MTYGEQMKKILDKFGIDTSSLPDNLYSTLLEAIYNADAVQNVVWVDNISGSLMCIKDSNNNYYTNISVFIKEINIPNGITSIGDSVFSKCTSLTSVTIPNTVTNIGASAFSKCTSLTSVTIPNTVTNIGASAFKECTSLTSVTIPDSLNSIVNGIFYGCTNLTSVTIPNTVTNIKSTAFYECSNLANIYYKGTEEQWNAISKESNWNAGMGKSVSGGTVIHYNS